MDTLIRDEYDISAYIADKEYIANKYVIKCFDITMLIYVISYFLNVLNIFTIDKDIMEVGFFPSIIIYLIMHIALKKVSLSDSRTKYAIFFTIVLVCTIMGVTITYHVVYCPIIPFLLATLYSSKKIMKYVYTLTVISTVIIVYGGYYFGLCDANMALLTTSKLADYVVDGEFVLTQVNSNPALTLFLFFVVPRCLIYIAFAFVCNNIFRIVSGSIEKAKISAELEKAKNEAENANRAKSQFLARMSHEIRTPINAVLGMNEMIIRESDDANIKQYAYDAKESSMLLINIINEILDSSKIESGMMEIVPGNYEIASTLSDLYTMINLKAKEKDIDLVFDVDCTIPSVYFGDEKRIKQVLLNILNNAVKYTDKGSVTLSLRADVDGDEAILHYSVKDTGIGIKEEDIAKIYDAFQRFDASRNKNIEGTGLGMNIAQQLLRLMGSELNIKSEYEKGSEFSFSLVQGVVDERSLGNIRTSVDSKKDEYRARIVAPAVRVLAVDDNKINLKVFKALLKSTKVQITTAESGEECLEILRNHQFDIIFLDHMMPGLDGIETLHCIKDENICPGVPIIMLTANAIIGDREKYLEEGFDNFLSKPIMQNALEDILEEHLPSNMIIKEENDFYVEEEAKGIPKIDEFDFEYAMGLLQKEELLKSLLKDFYESLDSVKEELEELFERIDDKKGLKEYRVKVHSLKSTSAMVGALLLSKLARLLEAAAKEVRIDKIRALHPILIEEIQVHKERLEVLFPKETAQLAVLDNMNLIMLESSLNNDDYNTADFIYGEIKKYVYEDSVQKNLDDLGAALLDLDGEKALSIINKMKY